MILVIKGKRYKIKNKKRFLSIIILTVILLIFAVISTSVYGFKDKEYINITVEKGDTLWNIAQTYNENQDIRKSIYQIKKINNIEKSDIYEGMILIIPVS